MAEIGNVTVRVDAVITDEQYHEAMSAVSAANEYIAALEAENAKLLEELSKWERLAAGIELPEYPVTQFKPKDLERENAKLRELARKMLKPFYWAQSGYEVCLSDEEDREIRDMLRDLGIEVPQ